MQPLAQPSQDAARGREVWSLRDLATTGCGLQRVEVGPVGFPYPTFLEGRRDWGCFLVPALRESEEEAAVPGYKCPSCQMDVYHPME